ncbi:sirohydrochlorin chelatase [Kocuria varians]|uniref:sirohydrochlorin chelatase n=1 Tax=Kocuria varians TaxID=1272 RepID=UPI0008396369|nr:CbiX/SirB N-terminal domain-containing protein [Kocuria varians]
MGGVSTPTSSTPVLLACAHGTRDPRGQAAVAALVAEVRAALRDVPVVATWVDVQEPDLAARTAEFARESAVVVPLLLSAGYHVFVDMARAVRGSEHHRVAVALGPDPRLATLLARRLHEAVHAAGESAVGPEDSVVMVSAGSSDPRAGEDCERVAEMLSNLLGLPVSTAYLSAAHPTLPEAVAAARENLATGDDAAQLSESAPGGRAGRVLVVPYLLAPGFFHGRALAAEADVVAEPLLVSPGPVPPELVELVVEHYREAAAAA